MGSISSWMHETVDQFAGTLLIRQVKAFGEPVVDRDDEVTSFGVLALIAPRTREGNCGTQLQRLRRTLAVKCQSRMKALLDFAHGWRRQQPAWAASCTSACLTR